MSKKNKKQPVVGFKEQPFDELYGSRSNKTKKSWNVRS